MKLSIKTVQDCIDFLKLSLWFKIEIHVLFQARTPKYHSSKQTETTTSSGVIIKFIDFKVSDWYRLWFMIEMNDIMMI